MTFLEYCEKNLGKFAFTNPELNSKFQYVVGPKSGVIPIDRLDEGKIGFAVWTRDPETGEDREMLLERQIFDKPNHVGIDSLDRMDRILEDSLAHNYQIHLWDNPKERVIGFIVVHSNEATWYFCNIKNARI